MKRLLLVRHGETEWNALRRLQGQQDIALSARGEDQARAIAPMIASLKPDHAMTSDLQRARSTAALLGFPRAYCEPRLREQGLGNWTGKRIASICNASPDAYNAWRAGDYLPPEGEDWMLFRQRVLDTLYDALQLDVGTVLMVCHGGVIRTALDTALAIKPSQILPVGSASLTVLAHTGNEFRLEAFNVRSGVIELNAPD